MDSAVAEVVVRVACAGDIEGLVASSDGLAREDGAARDRLRNPDWARQHAAQEYGKHIVNPDMLVLVAECDETIVGHLLGGFYGVSPMWTEPRAFLISMYVMPPWRGQNAGSHMVGQFTSWAKAKGAAELRVTAYSANEGAIRFYQRHGFSALDSTLALAL
jgi:GNAT superfamily N-acetyltransferase